MGKQAEENRNEVGRRTRNSLCVELVDCWKSLREKKTYCVA
jgi:hypothetical protein